MKQTVTINLTPETAEVLRKLSFTSRKNKSELVEEAILLLAKTPKENK